jgi:hypothetical protein
VELVRPSRGILFFFFVERRAGPEGPALRPHRNRRGLLPDFQRPRPARQEPEGPRGRSGRPVRASRGEPGERWMLPPGGPEGQTLEGRGTAADPKASPSLAEVPPREGRGEPQQPSGPAGRPAPATIAASPRLL